MPADAPFAACSILDRPPQTNQRTLAAEGTAAIMINPRKARAANKATFRP